jgi:phage terminase small subunit
MPNPQRPKDEPRVIDQLEIFCQRYAVTLSVTQAEEEAGYSTRYGYELLKKPDVIERIAQIQRNQGVHMIVTAGKLIREAAYLAYSDITEVLGCSTVADLKALPENVRKAIRKIKLTRTPIRRDGSRDRRSQSTTGGLAAMSESDQNCQKVTNEVEYEETIEIEMHSKTEAQRLLALVTDAVKDKESSDLLRKPAFTGLVVKTLTASEAAENVSNEQKRSDEDA